MCKSLVVLNTTSGCFRVRCLPVDNTSKNFQSLFESMITMWGKWQNTLSSSRTRHSRWDYRQPIRSRFWNAASTSTEFWRPAYRPLSGWQSKDEQCRVWRKSRMNQFLSQVLWKLEKTARFCFDFNSLIVLPAAPWSGLNQTSWKCLWSNQIGLAIFHCGNCTTIESLLKIARQMGALCHFHPIFLDFAKKSVVDLPI